MNVLDQVWFERLQSGLEGVSEAFVLLKPSQEQLRAKESVSKPAAMLPARI